MLINCPKCASLATVPIVSGKPDDALMEAAKHGLVVLAGCVIEPESFNRHCKACGCQFMSHPHNGNLFDLKQSITVWAFDERFDELEKHLTHVHESIERDYMQQGREGKGSCHVRVFDLMREYQGAWGLFMDWLLSCGNPTVVVDGKGTIMARYRNNTARIYLIKHNHLLYQSLQALAQASHWLGRTSRGDIKDVNDLLSASTALQNARQKVSDSLFEIRRAATSHFE